MDIVAPMEAALRFSDASGEMKELSRIKMSEAIRKQKDRTTTPVALKDEPIRSCGIATTLKYFKRTKEKQLLS